MQVTLADLFGISGLNTQDTIDELLKRWPVSRVQSQQHSINDTQPRGLLEELQNSLVFTAIRPGASGDRVGFFAEMYVRIPTNTPIVLTGMRAIGFKLLQSDPNTPSRV